MEQLASKEIKVCITHKYKSIKKFNPFSKKIEPKYDIAVHFFKSDYNEPQDALSYMNKSAGGANLHNEPGVYLDSNYDLSVDVFIKHIPLSVKYLSFSLNNLDNSDLSILSELEVSIFDLKSNETIDKKIISIDELENINSFIFLMIEKKNNKVNITYPEISNNYNEEHQYECNNLIGIRKTFKESMQ